jgi:hypothetical protein
MADIIKAQRRTYTEEQWRGIIRREIPDPLSTGQTEAQAIARVIDAQEVLPESAILARTLAQDELGKRRRR